MTQKEELKNYINIPVQQQEFTFTYTTTDEIQTDQCDCKQNCSPECTEN